MSKVLGTLQGKTISGKEFKKIFNDIPLLQFLNYEDSYYPPNELHAYSKPTKHRLGHTTNKILYNPEGKYESGGIKINILSKFMSLSNYYNRRACRVTVNDNAIIHIIYGDIICNEIVCDKVMEKRELITELFNECAKNGKLEFVLKQFEAWWNDNQYFKGTANPATKKFADRLENGWINPMLYLSSESVLNILTENPEAVQAINQYYLSEEFRMHVLKINPYVYYLLDGRYMASETLIALINKQPEFLNHIDSSELTPCVLRKILSDDPQMIKHLWWEQQCRDEYHDILIETVIKNKELFKYIESEYLILLILRQDFSVLQYLDKSHLKNGYLMRRISFMKFNLSGLPIDENNEYMRSLGIIEFNKLNPKLNHRLNINEKDCKVEIH